MFQKGYTIIEAIIVITILVLVAAMAAGFLTREPENVMIQKELTQFEEHIESVKDKVFIIEIDGKKHSVVVKDVQE
jgi:prepilin-type N-terminal cleavage/methylation domain-containing protein